jgi:hypothetical protein
MFRKRIYDGLVHIRMVGFQENKAYFATKQKKINIDVGGARK